MNMVIIEYRFTPRHIKRTIWYHQCIFTG